MTVGLLIITYSAYSKTEMKDNLMSQLSSLEHYQYSRKQESTK